VGVLFHAQESNVKTMLRGNVAAIVISLCVPMIAIPMGCEQSAKKSVQIETTQPMKDINEVIKVYSDSLMAIPGVVGLYHGLDDEGRSCLKVMVNKKTPEIVRRMPKQIEGFPVVIDETGEIKPMK
jgi:hypothetical protein